LGKNCAMPLFMTRGRLDAAPGEDLRFVLPWELALPEVMGGLSLWEVDYTAPLAQLSGKRITLSYEPWDDEAAP